MNHHLEICAQCLVPRGTYWAVLVPSLSPSLDNNVLTMNRNKGLMAA